MTRVRRFCAAGWAALVAACSTMPPSPPDATITQEGAPGPGWQQRSLRVVGEASDPRSLAALVTPDGALHVLHRQDRTGGSWLHTVVDAAGGGWTTEPVPERVFAGQPPSGFLWPTVDLAFDGDGVVHTLIDGHPLVRRDGAWARESGSTCATFVRGGPPLRCVGPPVEGVPAMRRFDLAILPGGLPVPYRGRVQKLAAYVLTPAGWQMQGVFDAAGNRDLGLFQGVATAGGDIHAVYQRARDVLGTPIVEWRYEMMPGPDTREVPLPSAGPQGPAASADDRGWNVACPLSHGGGNRHLWPEHGLAVDAVTGRGLVALAYGADDAGVVCQRTITPSGLGEPRVAFSGLAYRRIGLVALGEDRFAALLEEQAGAGWTRATPGRTFIATMRDGRWSAPEVLGRFGAIATRYGGQAPLVLRRDGGLSLVVLDAARRTVVIDLVRTP